MSTKARLRRMERLIAPKLTWEEYDAALSRQFTRRNQVLDASEWGHALKCLRALVDGNPVPPRPPPVELSPAEELAWKRDQDLIDAYHQKLGEPDGKSLMIWGRNPEEMLAHYLDKVNEIFSRPPEDMPPPLRAQVEETLKRWQDECN